MRYIRYVFMAVVGLSLILVALANRGMVTIKLLPDELAPYLGQPLSYDLPLFIVIFGGIIVGLLIGFVWEWFREHKHRADARLQKREKEKLEREVKGLKRKSNEGKDEVLALLDDSAAAR
jgi:uncharacterized integral membrane protein